MKDELIGLGRNGYKWQRKECWCLLNQFVDCPKLLTVIEICIELNIAHKYGFWLGD